MTADDLELQLISHQQARASIWAGVVCALAQAAAGKDSGLIVDWADYALREFDRRFPAPGAAGQ